MHLVQGRVPLHLVMFALHVRHEFDDNGFKAKRRVLLITFEASIVSFGCDILKETKPLASGLITVTKRSKFTNIQY